jgi:hypothetical protein
VDCLCLRCLREIAAAPESPTEFPPESLSDSAS